MKKKNILIAGAFFAAIVFAASCGVKGPPLPPEETKAEPSPSPSPSPSKSAVKARGVPNPEKRKKSQ